jgi:DNA-directed RNA polymerase specialized sigma24 family protein
MLQHRQKVAPFANLPPECNRTIESRQAAAPGTANIEIIMRTLDHRLYAWLAEPDDWRFERAFNIYFSAAFPALVRYLARRSQWDLVRLEDLAQEALLKFFDRVGRGRREASDTVGHALIELRSLDLRPFNGAEVKGWIEDVATFRDSTLRVGFLPENDEPADPHWKDTIRAIAERIPSLQSRGRALLDTVHWSDQDFFCKHVSAVITALPRLRVPTNSYLFQIARSIYLDECKKDGRHKRGGTIQCLDHGAAAEDSSAIDPTQQYENEELFARFYDYLRCPVEQASAAYRHAQATGPALPERRKLEMLANKLSRTMSVLSWTGAGYTQDQVAEKLGLSRNQVKYIIELVQQAYMQFSTAAPKLAAASPGEGEQSHVP